MAELLLTFEIIVTSATFVMMLLFSNHQSGKPNAFTLLHQRGFMLTICGFGFTIAGAFMAIIHDYDSLTLTRVGIILIALGMLFIFADWTIHKIRVKKNPDYQKGIIS